MVQAFQQPYEWRCTACKKCEGTVKKSGVTLAGIIHSAGKMTLRPEFEYACAERSFTCPLSHLNAGQVCRIKRLCASAEMCQRLREIGFCEDQVIKRLANQTAIICQVCNARLALSTVLAELIWVEPIDETFQAALPA